MYIQSNISGSLKDKRRKKVLIRLAFALFLLLVIFANFCFISRTEVLKIQEIKIFNSSSIPDQEITSVVKDIISGNYLFFISKQNFLLIPGNEIEESILKHFLKIEEAKVSLLSKDILSVEVKEREVKAKWCDNTSSDDSNCYLLDKNGLLFAPVPELFGTSLISFEGKLNGGDSLGSVYNSPTLFKDLFSFCQSLEKINFPVTRMVYDGKDFEIYLKNGAKIYFDDKQELSKTLGNIQSLVESKTIETSPEFLNKLNHLDLRYGNKVHFDFK
jgi:cell division septal protein FtsQ